MHIQTTCGHSSHYLLHFHHVKYHSGKGRNKMRYAKCLYGLPYQQRLLLVHCSSRVQTAVGGNHHARPQRIPYRCLSFRKAKGGERKWHPRLAARQYPSHPGDSSQSSSSSSSSYPKLLRMLLRCMTITLQPAVDHTSYKHIF